MFLDDDNEVAANTIWELCRALGQWSDTVMVGPAMYYATARDKIWCAGVERSRLLMRTSFRTRLPTPIPERLPSEDFPNGFMVRREQFEAVGGFDAIGFPQHMEESDLARRLGSLAGQVAYCVPTAKVWHSIDISLAHRLHLHDPARAYWTANGRAYFTAVYGTRLQWFLYAAVGQWALAALHVCAAFGGSRSRGAVALSYLRGGYAGFRRGLIVRRKARLRPQQTHTSG
jgi:GT2 family glycosyltransferase